LIVRPYQPGDIGPVTSLVRTVLASMDLRADYGGLGVDVHAVGEGEASGTWVAETEDGDVIGVAMALAAGAGRCELRRLYVAAEHARQGAGSALLAAALQWAARAGHSSLDVELRPELSGAEPFFRAQGFERRGDLLQHPL
jgi:GNAT superfamily N-acetyltransferase